MKLEINIDDKFLQSQLNFRELSFSRFLDIFKDTTNTIQKDKSEKYPTNIIDNKLIGNEFARMCGIPTAKILQVWEPIDKIAFAPKTVIKPVSGSSSKGVFVSYALDNIVYLNRGTKFSNARAARAYAKKLMEDNIVRRDRWMAEELLVDVDSIARDIKFYVFYGKVGLVLETERETGIKRCWYDEDLNYVITGKYLNNSFRGDRGDVQELKILAEKVSLEIPTPFVRIDFLVSNKKYYLGEFTPLPANYDGFSKEWDLYLGNYYAEAMVRMSHDIGQGKIFDKYNKLDKLWGSTLQTIRSRAADY